MGGGKSSKQASGVPEELLAQLHPLEIKLLPHLKDKATLGELASAAKMQEVEVSRATQWLENKAAITITATSSFEFSLDVNGAAALKEGMPEARMLTALQQGAKHSELEKKAKLSPQEMGACIGILKKRDLITLDKNKSVTLTAAGKKHNIADDPEIGVLKKVHEGKPLSQQEQDIAKELRTRKQYLIVKEKKERTITLTALGKQLAAIDPKSVDFAEHLTREDLESGAWKEKKYRAFDVTAPVPSISRGKVHFVEEAIEHIRKIWVEMGFEEMEGNIVQSAFWDLDALFVPQDHPARETQDTFYLEHPKSTTIDKEAFERVRATHEHGGSTGSLGWRTPYSKAEAQRLLVRTHTTVLSAQTLWKIRKGEAVMPGKYFTVGKVFRNEKLDWKHLFEFHQVEGIVVAKDVTFAQLVGYLKIFFAKMGFKDIRLRPHHFPYTEPSVEVDVWNERKQQWIELGGAGVFRPEVTKTLIGEEVPVLAWGLGLERTVVEYFGLTDLRDLYRNDSKQLREMRAFLKVRH